MKILTLLLLLYLCGCRPGRDIPQADMTTFQLISVDSTHHDGYHPQFAYKWMDYDRKVLYVIYSSRNYNYAIGMSLVGLIRK